MYDNICKFLAETYSRDFASWLLGEPLTLTVLSLSELSLEPIRADALILLESEEFILHLEFQTEPDENMPYRRFGEISPDVAEQIRGLPVESLEQLGEDLLDFSKREDLVAWLARN
jgi:predicted transposase/invertase (TIGR01784 family)